MTTENSQSYKVLLHNDDVNSMEYVVETLMKTVTGITQPQAVNAMMETHHSGVGEIVTCASDRAKFYCETLNNLGLNITIEPDN